jgi:crotonobetainyl-CoA:carnitine CoA-transferase CaiB-like acyl-CoA transferase
MSWPAPAVCARGPLAGVRVLDLSRILAGPYSATILSDLGADVIKVERPHSGDETRRWGPPFVDETAAYFYTANRNRRAITLDLKDEDDAGVARALAGDADVLIENFLPGATARFGLDYRSLRRHNQRLVYCSLTGYGMGTERERWPALDFIIQAHAGIMSVTGPGDSSPMKAGVPVADLAAGLFATIGILAALHRVETDGEGSHVEVALADACACLLANQAMNWLLGGVDPRAAGNRHPSLAPYETIEAQDRQVALAATSDLQFERLCEVIGLGELPSDRRFRTNADRVAHRNELADILRGALAGETAATWVQRLNEAGVAAAPVNTVAEALEDPDLRARLVARVGEGTDEVVQLRTPIRLDGIGAEVHTAPPALGADDEIKRSIQRDVLKAKVDAA